MAHSSTRSGWAARGLGLAALIAAASAAGGVHAAQQSDNEVRLENERLRTQVRDLERELEAARARIAELERQVADLQAMLAGAGNRSGSPLPQPPVTVDESVPNASPRALLQAIKQSFDEQTTDLEMGEPGDRDRIAAMRVLERWASRVNRELKSQIVWIVTVTRAPWHGERDPRLELQAIDPQTKAPLGEPIHAQVSRVVLRRLEELEQEGKLDEPLKLKGVLLPNVRINEYRQTPGAFDKPRFIGQFAECDPSVVVHSLSEPEEE